MVFCLKLVNILFYIYIRYFEIYIWFDVTMQMPRISREVYTKAKRKRD